MTLGARTISLDESDLIRFQISLTHRPSEVKAGLQRLCALYESGKRLSNDAGHSVIVRGLLLSEVIIIRRWAYKAIAWLGAPSDVDPLITLLGGERDPENQTWAMAAIIALATNRDLNDISAKTGAKSTQALLLAARLFRNERWLKENPDLPTIDIDNADALTLKWAALLSGYNRAPVNLFHPRIENGQLLAKLNTHSEDEVSEYSVWALWQNPVYGVSDLSIKVEDARRRPKNVRRWINRLITKTDEYLSQNVELIGQLREDDELPAREGLALGLRQIFRPGFEPYILDWHNAEHEETVRDLLLEHMATYSDSNKDYALLVEDCFKNAAQDSGIRKRLLTASAQKQLYMVLKGIAARQRAADDGLPLTNINLFTGSFTMTNFNAGRDIIGQNLVGGNMINSANDAVQKLSQSGIEKETLQSLLQFVQGAPDLTEEQKIQMAGAVQKAASEGSPEAKKGLFDTIKSVASAIGNATGTAATLLTFAQTISSWF